MSFVRLLFTLLLLWSQTVSGMEQSHEPRFDRLAHYFHAFWLATGKRPISSPDRALLEDPDRKLPSHLQVPPLLKDRVYFWMQIYGSFSSWMRVLHDREIPNLIYGVLDCSPLYELRKTRMEREILCDSMEREAKLRMKRLLQHLDRNPSLETFILAHGVMPAELTFMSKRLRIQKGQKDIYLLALQRSQRLLPMMESTFEARSVPSHLTRIPFVESSFHPRAKSKVAAMGLWQFMPQTAKAFIHQTDKSAWRDPILQTDGAAKMLRRNQGALNDWGLTVTSYNSGVGRILKLSKRYSLKNVQELLFLPEPAKRLGFAGKNFYAEFLAANLLYTYQKESFYSELLAGPMATLLPVPK